MNFVHTADLHLGYRQYDLDERLRDFGRSFREIARFAIAEKSGFVLIAGDLFHARNINAPTYHQAHHVLSMLKEAGIPCIVIEGNHDRAFVRDGASWLWALEQQGLLTLIKPGEPGHLMKNYADVGDTRIFGLCYVGASTPKVIPEVAREIAEINAGSPPKRTVLMLHTGIEGQVIGPSIVGETSYEDIARLKGVVDYLALGHYHNAYRLEDWAFNPGSPETCSIAECSVPKGFYLVEDGKARFVPHEGRPFKTIVVPVDGHLTAASLLEEFGRRLAAIPRPEAQPVVHVIFRGSLGFDKSHLDPEEVRSAVIARLDPLYVDVKFDMTNDEFGLAAFEGGTFDRLAIEREVLSRFASADSMLSDYAEYYASALSEIKDLAVKEADPETLDGTLRKAYDSIRERKAPVTARPAGEPLPVVQAPPPVEEKKPAPKKAARPKAAKARPESPEIPAPTGKTLDEFWRK